MSLNGLHRKVSGCKFVGLFDDLRIMYNKNFISTKLKMASSQEGEDHVGPTDNYSPPPGNDVGI